MGQSSLKYLNRVGYSLHWDKNWESKNVYGHYFIKFFFVDFFFTNFFKNNFFKKYRTFRSDGNLVNSISHSHKFYDKISFFNKPLKMFMYSNFFQSKIWVLNYQGWVIINIYVYFPKRLKRGKLFDKKNLLNLTQKKFDSYKYKYNFL